MSAKNAIDTVAVQNAINTLAASENPPKNVTQYLKSAGAALGLNPTNLFYHVQKGNVTLPLEAKPRKNRKRKNPTNSVAAKNTVLLVEVKNNVAVNVTAFPSKEKAIDAFAGMLQNVRKDLEEKGWYNTVDTCFSLIEHP